MRWLWIGWVCALNAVAAPRFEKVVLNNEYLCDGIHAGDINRDGRVDIVAGPFWYEGPEFKSRHEFYWTVTGTMTSLRRWMRMAGG